MDIIRQFLPEQYWNRERRYYAQQVDFNTLAASAVQQTEEFRQDLQSDFLVQSIAAVETTDATGATEQPFFEFLVQIQSNGGQTNWTNGFVHAATIFGRLANDGRGPLVLPTPQFVPGGTSVSVIATNLEATERRVWVTFHGVVIYRDRVRR